MVCNGTAQHGTLPTCCSLISIFKGTLETSSAQTSKYHRKSNDANPQPNKKKSNPGPIRMFSAETNNRNFARTVETTDPSKRRVNNHPNTTTINNISREQRHPPPQPQIKRINSINWTRELDAKTKPNYQGIGGPNGVFTLPVGSDEELLDPPPLIADIIRTGYCVPGSVFLVERIEDVRAFLEEEEEYDEDEDEAEERLEERVIRTINNLGGRTRRGEKKKKIWGKRKVEYRAVRLLLGDGEICVQALLTPGAYSVVDGGEVYEGCYVRCERFELVVVDGDEEDDGVGDPARRGKSGRKMFYLLVRDVVAVGWNEVYLAILRGDAMEGGEAVAVGDGNGKVADSKAAAGFCGDHVKAPVLRELAIGTVGTMTRQFEGMAMPAQVIEQPGPVKEPLVKTTTAPPLIVKDNLGDIEYISDSDDEAFEKLQISIDRATERRAVAERNGPLQELQAAVLQQNQRQTKALPLAITDPHQPLKLTPLRSIPNLPYKQNWMVNVLAVVASLSAVEPSHLPPYNQRTARLADPSTTKRVLLNVFLDPEGFTPAVGSVVLLVGVKNHRFDGGCLKKYASDRPRDGTKSWWLENPSGLEWCEREVVKLRKWWDEQQQQQQQQQQEDRMQIV